GNTGEPGAATRREETDPLGRHLLRGPGLPSPARDDEGGRRSPPAWRGKRVWGEGVVGAIPRGPTRRRFSRGRSRANPSGSCGDRSRRRGVRDRNGLLRVAQSAVYHLRARRDGADSRAGRAGRTVRSRAGGGG